MGEAQDTAAAKEEGDKTELVEESRCWIGLEPWVSLWSNHFGEESTSPIAWTEGNKRPPGRRGTRGTGATKSTAAEELAPVLGEVAEQS